MGSWYRRGCRRAVLSAGNGPAIRLAGYFGSFFSPRRATLPLLTCLLPLDASDTGQAVTPTDPEHLSKFSAGEGSPLPGLSGFNAPPAPGNLARAEAQQLKPPRLQSVRSIKNELRSARLSFLPDKTSLLLISPTQCHHLSCFSISHNGSFVLIKV